MGIMTLVSNVATSGPGGDDREPTWQEAVAEFEAAQPVELARSARKILVIYRYVDGRFLARSPELRGFEVSDSSLRGARELAHEALCAYLDPAVEIVECLPSQQHIDTAAASRSTVASPWHLPTSSHGAANAAAYVSQRGSFRQVRG